MLARARPPVRVAELLREVQRAAAPRDGRFVVTSVVVQVGQRRVCTCKFAPGFALFEQRDRIATAASASDARPTSHSGQVSCA